MTGGDRPNNAKVVCRQLGYSTNGAQYFQRAYRYFGKGTGPIILDNVYCSASDELLLDCQHSGLFRHNCGHNDDVGVRCQVDDRLQNISATIISSTSSMGVIFFATSITWELQNKTLHEPYLFEVGCFNEQHKIVMSVSNKTFSAQLHGLFSSTSYTCCVFALFRDDGRKRLCTTVTIIGNNIMTTTIHPSSASAPSEILATDPNEDFKILSTDSKGSTCNTVGGVLGFIIAILVVMLAACVTIIIVYLLLRSRSLQHIDKNTADVNISRNLSYEATPSHSATSESQAISLQTPADEVDTVADHEYSKIGPAYETINPGRKQSATQKRNSASSRLLNQRCQFSAAHITATAIDVDGGTHGVQGELGSNYEVPLNLRQIEEHVEYSRLQH